MIPKVIALLHQAMGMVQKPRIVLYGERCSIDKSGRVFCAFMYKAHALYLVRSAGKLWATSRSQFPTTLTELELSIEGETARIWTEHDNNTRSHVVVPKMIWEHSRWLSYPTGRFPQTFHSLSVYLLYRSMSHSSPVWAALRMSTAKNAYIEF